MKQYLDLMKHVLDEGVEKEDRTGTGTISVFGGQISFNLQERFPIITTREINFRNVVNELLFFFGGTDNINNLPEDTKKWWDKWAYPNGDLGPMYGSQLRKFGWGWTIDPVDQLQDVIEAIKTDPNSRRHVITLWNPLDLPYQALACCHGTVIQFNVTEGHLSCHMYQRSADLFLGVPANISSYALFTHMIAQVCNLQVGNLIISFGDLHIYKNHIDQCVEQLNRDPVKIKPVLILNSKIKDIDDFKAEDINLVNYCPHPHIKAKISI